MTWWHMLLFLLFNPMSLMLWWILIDDHINGFEDDGVEPGVHREQDGWVVKTHIGYFIQGENGEDDTRGIREDATIFYDRDRAWRYYGFLDCTACW